MFGRVLLFFTLALPAISLPSAAQEPVCDRAVETASTIDPSQSVVVPSGRPSAEADACRPFLHLESLGGVVLPTARADDRPDSDLPKSARYVLGGIMAGVSAASVAGSVGLGRATVSLFRSDAPLSSSLGVLTGILTAGSVGFAVMSAVWSVRLFRGKAVLLPPTR